MLQYTAEMILGISVEVNNHSQFLEFITPLMKQVCGEDAEIISQTLPNGCFNAHAIILRKDMGYVNAKKCRDPIFSLIHNIYHIEIMSVGIELYLMDTGTSTVYWSDLNKNGNYVIAIGEDNGPIEVEPSRVKWGNE